MNVSYRFSTSVTLAAVLRLPVLGLLFGIVVVRVDDFVMITAVAVVMKVIVNETFSLVRTTANNLTHRKGVSEANRYSA